jgi:phosphoribosyl-dephospho-CoA transferase
MRRHDLIFVSPTAWWRSLLESSSELAADPLVGPWVDRGWPLIGRRVMPGEEHGIALGLPLPPFAGKRRLSFVMRPEDILSTSSPLTLKSALGVASPAWRSTLERLGELASQYSIEARVFGSLAWRALTGLDYLTDRSDLDLLLYVHRETNLRRLATDVAEIDASAPMRIDGEFIRYDGAAVNWREFHVGGREILVKTIDRVAVFDRSSFLLGVAP